jgi:DnaJ-domain-containing protein 1
METDVGRNIDTMTTNIAEAKRAMGEAFFAMADGVDPDAEPDYDYDPDADSDSDSDTGPEPEAHMTRMEALELLGVKNSSDQEAIGKAYRELVLKWHPDKNPGKEAEVTPMFCRVRKAYELLTA